MTGGSGPDQVLSGSAYKVLALQVELCSPRLIRLARQVRRRVPFGLSAGVLAGRASSASLLLF
jgi:hypothetical protein